MLFTLVLSAVLYGITYWLRSFERHSWDQVCDNLWKEAHCPETNLDKLGMQMSFNAGAAATSGLGAWWFVTQDNCYGELKPGAIKWAKMDRAEKIVCIETFALHMRSLRRKVDIINHLDRFLGCVILINLLS